MERQRIGVFSLFGRDLQYDSRGLFSKTDANAVATRSRN
jgi:hypothetical protein